MPSLRNLVSGYEVGRVFPAVVGPGSPLRDAANWLPSRFGQSVEMRRRYGCLRMVFPGVRLFRALSLVPFGRVAARERQGALSQRAWKSSIGWGRTRFREGEGKLDRRRARGGLNSCARESKARTGRFLKNKMMSDHDHFSSYEGRKERRMGKIRGAFTRMHGALEGWMLARAPASPAQGLRHHGPRYFNFPYFCTMYGLKKLGLVNQNWLGRKLSALLLRTLVVGRRQQSESIEAALDME